MCNQILDGLQVWPMLYWQQVLCQRHVNCQIALLPNPTLHAEHLGESNCLSLDFFFLLYYLSGTYCKPLFWSTINNYAESPAYHLNEPRKIKETGNILSFCWCKQYFVSFMLFVSSCTPFPFPFPCVPFLLPTLLTHNCCQSVILPLMA